MYIAPIIGTFLAEFVQALTKTIDCPPLLFVFSCVVIPPDIPPAQSSDSFEDPIEEEAFDHQCIPEYHFNENRALLICSF
jgi:hypothetical protein